MFGKRVWQAVLLAVCGTFGVASAAEPLTLERALADDVRLDAILHNVKGDLLSQSAGWCHRGWGGGWGCGWGGYGGFCRPYAFGCYRAPICYSPPICYTPVYSCYPSFGCGFPVYGVSYSSFGYTGFGVSGLGYSNFGYGFSSYNGANRGYANPAYGNSLYANRAYSNPNLAAVNRAYANNPYATGTYSNSGYSNSGYSNYANAARPGVIPAPTPAAVAPVGRTTSYTVPAQRPVYNFANYAREVAPVPAIYAGCYYW